MPENKPVNVTFELVGDNFPHAWYYNKFRIDPLSDGLMVSFAFSSERFEAQEINAVVLSKSDLNHNRSRVSSYLEKAGAVPSESIPTLKPSSPPPARLYPVNHINLARVDSLGEIGFYRFSINTLVDSLHSSIENPAAKNPAVKCYPVVMFRSDLAVQLALLKEVYTQ